MRRSLKLILGLAFLALLGGGFYEAYLKYELIPEPPLVENPSHPLKDLTIIVPSCDKYKELWPLHFKFLFQYWSSLQTTYKDIPIILISNYESFEDPRIRNIKVGRDIAWSNNLLEALKEVKTRYVLLLLEDYIITDPVPVDRLIEVLNLMKKDHAAYTEVFLEPGLWDGTMHASAKGVMLRKSVSRYKNDSLEGRYRASLQACIWNVQDLKKTLRKGENAWQFESTGSNRTQYSKRPFYILTEEPVFRYSNAAYQGKIHRSFLKSLKDQGIEFEPKILPISEET